LGKSGCECVQKRKAEETFEGMRMVDEIINEGLYLSDHGTMYHAILLDK